MAVGDLFKITTDWGNVIAGAAGSKSVFFYRVATQTGAITAENVADDFVANVLTDIVLNTFSFAWSCNALFTENLADSGDFNITNPALEGALTGDLLPTFVAWTARSPWPGPGTRRAYKRFPCPNAAALGPNQSVWDQAYQDVLKAEGTRLGQLLVLSGGSLEPAVVRANCAGGGTPCTYEFLSTAAGKWQVNSRPTTQNSRKVPNNWLDTDDPA
jgi:hypothetical protein